MSTTVAFKPATEWMQRRPSQVSLKYAYEQRERIDEMRSRGALTLVEGEPEPFPQIVTPPYPKVMTGRSVKRTLTRTELKVYGVVFPFVATKGEQLWTRRELRETDWTVVRGQHPVRMERRAAAYHYDGQWHSGIIGLYSVRQCIQESDAKAIRMQRLVSHYKSREEWEPLHEKMAAARLAEAEKKPKLPTNLRGRQSLADRLMKDKLRRPSIRLYLYLCYLAVQGDSDVVTSNDRDLVTACYLDDKSLKSYKAELVRNRLIEVQRVRRQTQYTISQNGGFLQKHDFAKKPHSEIFEASENPHSEP